MSRPDLDTLDPDLDALLEMERRRPSVAPDVQARVLAQVVATLGTPGPDGGGSSSPGGGASPPPLPPAAAGGLLAKPILLGAALGGLVAAGIVARPDAAPPAPRPAVSAPIVASAPAPRGGAPEAPAAVPERAPEPEIKAPVPPPRASADDPVSAGHDGGLAAERRILEEALRALGGGNGAAALDALGRHAAEFPRGQLQEEREALWIRALARAGRLDDARARASRFRASFPRSLMLPSIQATVGEIP